MLLILFIPLCKPRKAPKIDPFLYYLTVGRDNNETSSAFRTLGHLAAGGAVDCLAAGAHAHGAHRHPDDGAYQSRSAGGRRTRCGHLFIRFDFLHRRDCGGGHPGVDPSRRWRYRRCGAADPGRFVVGLVDGAGGRVTAVEPQTRSDPVRPDRDQRATGRAVPVDPAFRPAWLP
ncbi:hypothetical protein D3C73_814690 [compost metagenome]